MKKLPEGLTLFCYNKKQVTHNQTQVCLSPNFIIHEDELLHCCDCGTNYKIG